jgi:hypothetical protein
VALRPGFRRVCLYRGDATVRVRTIVVKSESVRAGVLPANGRVSLWGK